MPVSGVPLLSTDRHPPRGATLVSGFVALVSMFRDDERRRLVIRGAGDEVAFTLPLILTDRETEVES